MTHAIIKITGESPLLMHSDRLANPLDEQTKRHKKLTSNRKKTDSDQEAIAKSEYLLALYLREVDGKARVVLPTQNVRRSIVEGGRLNKLGKAIERSVIPLDDYVKLDYSGPKDPEKLWLDPNMVDCRSVVISRARLMRYRPKFSEWSCSMRVLVADDMINIDDLQMAATNGGMYCGLCDYRPSSGGSFGRYSVEVITQ